MMKIQHFSIPQIVKKRQQISNKNRPSRKIIKQDKNQQKQIVQDQKQLNYDQILYETIDKIKIKGSQSLNNEQKSKLIDFVSKRTGLHLNKDKIIPNMVIKQINNIQIVDKTYSQQSKLKEKDKEIKSIFKPKEDDVHIKQKKNQYKKSYFLLSGSMTILSANPFDKKNSTFQQSCNPNNYKYTEYQDQESKQTTFLNKKQLLDQFPNHFQFKIVQEQTGHGELFNYSKQLDINKSIQLQKQNNQITFSTTQPLSIDLNAKKTNNALKSLKNLINLPKLLVCQNAIIIQIQGTEYNDQYINYSGLSLQKIEQIVQNFKVFQPLGKKKKNYIQFFELRQFQRNQKIYETNQKADKFYLLIKGEVVFQSRQSKNQPQRYDKLGKVKNMSPQRSHSNSLNQSHYCLRTQTLSPGSYFGQQQLIYQIQKRNFSSICKSSYCQVLILAKQKFQKMLQYSDFAQLIKKAAKIKFNQRQQKVIKANFIRNKFTITQYNQDKMNEQDNSITSQRQTVNLFRSRRGSIQGKYKLMHGNIIKTFSKQKNTQLNEDIQFSMLGANPDMYENTLKKFRKFNVKVPDKKKAQVNWNLERVWKVLNLQNILREDGQVTSSEGRKYYDSHKRFINQVSQSKSLRPKTSSTTYRTKLQYIAYLQQFKN